MNYVFKMDGALLYGFDNEGLYERSLVGDSYERKIRQMGYCSFCLDMSDSERLRVIRTRPAFARPLWISRVRKAAPSLIRPKGHPDTHFWMSETDQVMLKLRFG